MATDLVRVSLVTGLLAGLLTAGCEKTGGTASPSDTYYDLGITLTDMSDEEVALVSATKQDVHVLAFWATWCQPCTGELAQLQKLHDAMSTQGLKVYGISIDGPDTISRVPGFVAQEKWSFPILYDPETALLARYNPKGDIPFYVILDADGNIIKSHQGFVLGDEVELEKFLSERLSAE
jgi:peroxiredoxin